ncbi:hypothetical protein BVRB_1g023070 [Beta vulgaris subsp. vulgaris]|uniref:Uncharacterized protein n=1 Tax=Beta vulgaris subsp. vulgaris TaxID=3555 RepID=A0A0J8BF36_BETVV|nr:hypothetical protein BVRB_1g023070 [Beta vulgaris subsp. vulgaris]
MGRFPCGDPLRFTFQGVLFIVTSFVDSDEANFPFGSLPIIIHISIRSFLDLIQ